MSRRVARRSTRRKGERYREVEPADLRWICRPGEHDLTPSDRDGTMVGIIGQDRAIQALKLGIELYGPGMNVFVSGITGTGRSYTVQKILSRIKGNCPLPPDRCYVHNFQKEDEPRLLTLPRGFGARFQSEMERFVRWARTELPEWLESEDYSKMRDSVVGRYEGEADRIIERFERRAEKQGFALKRVREGNIVRPELFPVIEGHATSIGDLEALVSEGKVPPRKAEEIARQYDRLRGTLESTARQSRDLLGKMESEISENERRRIREALQQRTAAIVAKFPESAAEALGAYLREVVDALVASIDQFRAAPAARAAAMAPGDGGAEPARVAPPRGAGLPTGILEKLRVNVIFDSRKHGACPVIVETHPSYRRIFGYFEKSLDASGHWSTDYSRVRAGSLLSADGGYLVVTAEDLFAQRDVWVELKRTLISRCLSINEEAGSWYPAIALKPEPISINAKVILIGQRSIYDYLLDTEPDFKKIFKVYADFDEEMDLTPKTLRQYAAFAHRVAREEKLAPIDPGAVAVLAEHGARMAGRKGKLTTRFGEIADLIREADYRRRSDGAAGRVLARHVREAIRQARERHSLSEEKIREMIRDGQIYIDLEGSRVGQLNGLVVHTTGIHAFGLPTRITATVSPGSSGIVSIEREARLSGRTHTKGVLIIGGFLRETFGQSKPVALTSSITFEQSYADVEGDSASSTEVYALLSSLSGVPLRQEIAVTGSVDQKGDIQPVGGINEKIEGFFRVCRSRGLTGTQGVIVPESNRIDLMLDEEVVAMVRARRFHIYPVRTIQEGIEILTGIPAGSREASGRYPEGTIFRLVDDRLDRFNETLRRLGPQIHV